MLVTPIQFRTTLNNKMLNTDVVLPLTSADTALLTSLISDGDYTFLTLREPTGVEIIKVENSCSSLTVTRAQDGTTARTFPKGSCVACEITPAMIKDLICNYNCCDGECPCNAVTAAGFTAPDGTLNVPYSASFVFSGDVPMTLAVNGNLPAWVTVTTGTNYVTFTGTPNVVGNITLAVSATNCSGELATQATTITIASS